MTSSEKQAERPVISVICPVYNAEQYLPYLFESLRQQTYPASKFEVILVDNGSTDGSKKMIAESDFRLYERTDVASSYAARNKGLEIAKGGILAFTDSDCRPAPDWLEKGVKAMTSHNAPDMLAGRVSFVFSYEADPWETYDALFNINMEEAVSKGHAATANLFVKRSVFEKQGKFSEAFTSGEDFMWTHRAVENGIRLTYAPEVIVEHPTRQKGDLKKKSLRVGSSLINTHAIYSKSIPPALLYLLFVVKNLLPPSPVRILAKIKGADERTARAGFLPLYVVAYAVKFFRVKGLLSALAGKKIR